MISVLFINCISCMWPLNFLSLLNASWWISLDLVKVCLKIRGLLPPDKCSPKLLSYFEVRNFGLYLFQMRHAKNYLETCSHFVKTAIILLKFFEIRVKKVSETLLSSPHSKQADHAWPHVFVAMSKSKLENVSHWFRVRSKIKADYW